MAGLVGVGAADGRGEDSLTGVGGGGALDEPKGRRMPSAPRVT